MNKLRVLVVDDHQILREGLRRLIDSQPGMRVVGEAVNGKELLAQAKALKPDIVVMDLSMPELNGLQATARLIAESPAVKVVVLTAHEDESYLRQLCQAGASGYVLKRSAGEELIKAIATVAKGGVHYDPALASKALARQAFALANDRELGAAKLSDREKEVLVSLAWGYSNKEIAAKLALSVKTVETYKVRIGEKLRLHSRTEMVKFALRQGWLNDTA
ncbi:MAG TPA: response regulator transcription factor [Candidatus Acidoferrum sp.]|nr:response regulator transcription factor [Candidatus Acidoferrum sp.]